MGTPSSQTERDETHATYETMYPCCECGHPINFKSAVNLIRCDVCRAHSAPVEIGPGEYATQYTPSSQAGRDETHNSWSSEPVVKCHECGHPTSLTSVETMVVAICETCRKRSAIETGQGKYATRYAPSEKPDPLFTLMILATAVLSGGQNCDARNDVADCWKSARPIQDLKRAR